MVITKEERIDLVNDIRRESHPGIAMYKHIIVFGPSGSGKSTIIRKDANSILRVKPAIYDFSVSATTRKQRGKEEDGLDYHFWSNVDFDMAELFESNEYLGNKRLYGTLVSEMRRIALIDKKRIAFDIDINGAMAIKEEFGNDAIGAFLDVPIPTLRERLMSRLSETGETEQDVEKRLDAAVKEKKMVKDGIFVPDVIVPYDNNVLPGEGTNLILLHAEIKTAI